MLAPLGKVWKIQPKDKEYVFKLYSFEGQKDFFFDDKLLDGQSVVFISELYEKEDGKYIHNILYARGVVPL